MLILAKLFFSYLGGVPIILVPNAGGIPVSPVLPVGNNALNTVPAQQSFEMPLLLDSDNTGLQSVPQASTLTPQLQSLDDSIASSQQSQNTVTAESSLERSLGALTTVDTPEISQQVSLTGGGPESNRTDLVGGQQETENLKSADQERQSDVENTDSFPIAEKEPVSVTAVTGDQESSGPLTLPTPDVEVLSCRLRYIWFGKFKSDNTKSSSKDFPSNEHPCNWPEFKLVFTSP